MRLTGREIAPSLIMPAVLGGIGGLLLYLAAQTIPRNIPIALVFILAGAIGVSLAAYALAWVLRPRGSKPEETSEGERE